MQLHPTSQTCHGASKNRLATSDPLSESDISIVLFSTLSNEPDSLSHVKIVELVELNFESNNGNIL